MVTPPFATWAWLVFFGLVHHGDHCFVARAGKRCATPLLAVLVVVETSDLHFAVDSVPAVLSVTQTAFVAYSSIVFAVLGLRALYFALGGLVDRFVYLHYGLAVILVAIVASIAVSLGATRRGRSGGYSWRPLRRDEPGLRSGCQRAGCEAGDR